MTPAQEYAVVAWLKALSHPVRLRTLGLLAEQGELTVSDLIDQIDGLGRSNQSALSQHLSILRRERVVDTRRDKQYIYYRLNDDQYARMLDILGRLKAA